MTNDLTAGAIRRALSAPWPHYDEEQLETVARVLRSGRVNYWTGEEGRSFEQEYATYLGRRHAIALSNGTVALELALRAFGVGAGDEVIVPSRTYIASASCAAMCGAVPVVVDVDAESQCLTVETITPAITSKTRAIVAVHLAGWPCDMDSIMALAGQHDLVVIEDCAQAHGAFYKGRPVGAFGHAAAFSFCQDKIMTTGGEGGLLALDDDQAWSLAWSFKDIGRSYDAVYNRDHPAGFRWLTESFGTNMRMTELQAALGRLQLRRLPAWTARRAQNAAVLSGRLRSEAGVRVPQPPLHVEHAWYKFYAFVEAHALKDDWSRDRIMLELNAVGVPCSVGSCSEIYREKAFTDNAWGPHARLPTAAKLGDESLCLLVHPTLSTESLEQAAAVFIEVLRQARR